MTFYYTGIGSRSTPPHICGIMTRFAERMREDGWVLRSGHAEGADQAFEAGAKDQAEIYLPWPGFNGLYEWSCGDYHVFSEAQQAAYTIAERFHPNWPACGSGARKLHARNVHQILGRDVEDPVLSLGVICWTPDGSLDGQGPRAGGTGQALRIASAYGVPVLNLARPEHLERVERWLEDPVAVRPAQR